MGDIHQKDATYPWQLGHLQVICTESLPSCLTLCNPLDYSPPGSSVHGILQARILEWVSRPWSKGSSQPRDWTHISYVSCLGNLVLYHWVTRHSVSLKRRHLLKILSRGLKVHRHSHLSGPTSFHVLQLCPITSPPSASTPSQPPCCYIDVLGFSHFSSCASSGRPCLSTLQGFQTPGPQTATRSWPVRNPVTQQEWGAKWMKLLLS